MRSLTFLVSSLAIASLAQAVAAQVAIVPPTPRYMETVRVQVPSEAVGPISRDVYEFGRISMAGNKVTVVVVNRGPAATLPEPAPGLDYPIGQFPTGEYEVEVRIENPAGALLRTAGSSRFSVRAPSGERLHQAPINVTDLWWTPEESGWGINLVHHPSEVIFATWFVYDGDGKPVWYVVPDARGDGRGLFTGAVYRTTGPGFCYTGEPCLGDFDPARVTRTAVGSATFSVHGYDRVLVTLTVDGRTLARTVRRQPF